MKDTILVEVPKAKRRRNAMITLAATIGFTAFVVGHAWAENQIGYPTLFVVPFFILGIVQSYMYWRTTHVQEPSHEAVQRELEERAETQRKEDEFYSRWYVRYSLAAICLWGSWHFLTAKNEQVWLAVIAALMAALFAREISFLIIVLGVLYLLFIGVAALPVSVAVVIGAIIIAFAIRKRTAA